VDVDSGNGCSSSVAGSRVKASICVFRVALSGSGLRRFAMYVPAPGFLASRDANLLGAGSALAVAMAVNRGAETA
jgi:hypothetical protein